MTNDECVTIARSIREYIVSGMDEQSRASACNTSVQVNAAVRSPVGQRGALTIRKPAKECDENLRLTTRFGRLVLEPHIFLRWTSAAAARMISARERYGQMASELYRRFYANMPNWGCDKFYEWEGCPSGGHGVLLHFFIPFDWSQWQNTTDDQRKIVREVFDRFATIYAEVDLNDAMFNAGPTNIEAHGPCADGGEMSVEKESDEKKEELVENTLFADVDPFADNCRAAVISVEQLLRMPLRIPSYQRPYKWTRRNVEELLGDIKHSLDAHDSEAKNAPPLKYRLGTVILDGSRGDGKLDVVDGQQRILTLLLINRAIESIRKNEIECPILNDRETLRLLAANVVSRRNLHENYAVVRSVLSRNYDLRKRIVLAFCSTLEMVVIRVDKVAEAFQLFDSQNARGRPLDPHDLLKAHHLRAMAKDEWWLEDDGRKLADQINDVVHEWESHSSRDLRELFDQWLFRIGNWMQKRKTHPFAASDIQAFKGVSYDSPYSFASRARAAMPNSDDQQKCRQFQIDADFVEGREFFRMVSYYLRLVKEIKTGAMTEGFKEIGQVIKADDGSTGFDKVLSLFQCAILCFVDRFGREALQDVRVTNKLCLWAFTLRINMAHVSEDTINRYAVIDGGADYTNTIPLFAMIKAARSPAELAIIDVYGPNSSRHKRKDGETKRESMVKALKGLEA